MQHIIMHSRIMISSQRYIAFSAFFHFIFSLLLVCNHGNYQTIIIILQIVIFLLFHSSLVNGNIAALVLLFLYQSCFVSFYVYLLVFFFLFVPFIFILFIFFSEGNILNVNFTHACIVRRPCYTHKNATNANMLFFSKLTLNSCDKVTHSVGLSGYPSSLPDNRFAVYLLSNYFQAIFYIYFVDISRDSHNTACQPP